MPEDDACQLWCHHDEIQYPYRNPPHTLPVGRVATIVAIRPTGNSNNSNKKVLLFYDQLYLLLESMMNSCWKLERKRNQ